MAVSLYASVNKAVRQSLQNPGILFIVKFLCYVVVLYYTNILFISLTSPEGIYAPLIAQYFDYIATWRYSLLHTASYLLNILGWQTELIGPYKMKLAGSNHTVTMVYSCIGYGVTSVWIAFVLAMQLGWKSKFIWSLFGFVSLFILNCLRIIAILLAHGNLSFNSWLDHHALFNIIAYGFIFSLMYWMIKKQEYGRDSAPTVSK